MSRTFRLVEYFLIASLITVPSAGAVECFTPSAWQPKLTETPRDSNHNLLEDSLEVSTGVVNVVLDLNDCPVQADITRLARFGSVEQIGRFLSFVVLSNVAVADLPMLAADPLVAFVEEDSKILFMLDTSRGTIGADRVTTMYGFDGKEVNIAVVDSGVDDGVHQALPAEVFAFGYDAVTQEFKNPDDEAGHGTFVAGIALGRQVPGTTSCGVVPSGIAPGAKLIDIRVGDEDGASLSTMLHGLEVALGKQVEWSLRVLNVSLADCKASNGTDSFSQYMNRLVAGGIVVVAAAGNTITCGLPNAAKRVVAPGAADDVISVANSSDLEDTDRTNDELSLLSMRGPRTSDKDGDELDEQKPDLAAPGTDIRSSLADTECATGIDGGTSFAAPHVAGCAALIINAFPAISPQSVKRLLLETAEDRGDTGWDAAWGHGLVDCFAAVDRIVQTVRADLKFEVYVDRPDVEWWFSPDVFPETPIVEKQPNTIHAIVTNAGPAAAVGATVRLGVYNFSNGDLEYSICTVPLPASLAKDEKAEVTCPYTPVVSGKPPGTVHACLKAEIVYPSDSDFTNNRAQHNVEIQQAKSPAVFNVRVVNPTQLDLIMHLRERFVSGQGWRLVKQADSFLLRADDCPRTVTLELVPDGPGVSPSAEVSVAVVGTTAGGQDIPLGGVVLVGELAFDDCNSNGVPDDQDVVSGTSQDLNGSGIPDECERNSVRWRFSGTAQGGSISATVQGLSATCTVVLTTSPGQSGVDVAAALAAAMTADACFQGQGITAEAFGGTLTVTALDLTDSDVSEVSTDPGIVHEIVVSIPTLSEWALLLLAVLLAAAGAVILQRGRTRRRTTTR